jgi:hypothetical protein
MVTRRAPLPASRFPFPAALLAALVLTAVGAEPLGAQIPFPTPQGGQTRPDSTGADTVKVPAFRVEPPVSPLGSAVRSLLLPGWGQAVLERRTTGAAFVFWEGLALTMTIKAAHQLHYLNGLAAPDTALVRAKRQEVQDWAVLLGFNHLLAAAEAFVSANFWDFPGEIEGRSFRNGAVGVGWRFRF